MATREGGTIVPVDQFMGEVQVDRVSLERVIIVMMHGYRDGQWMQDIQALDFGELLRRTGIVENLPPKSGTQTDWNNMKDALRVLHFPHPEAQILEEHYQYGNIAFRGNFIFRRLSELHTTLQRLRDLKSELTNTDAPGEMHELRMLVGSMEKHKIDIVASLDEAGYTLPFEV